jgi:hypothetical protein
VVKILSVSAIASAVVVLVLAGCGAVASPGDDGVGGPPPASSGELIGQGTVLAKDGTPPMLCLGAVMESFPPQCSGPEMVGWDWDAADHYESSGGVTWGTYAVHGTWDGAAFTVTRPPIPLALYDPPANIDPRTDPANRGEGVDAELESLQQELHQDEGSAVLTSWVENGYLFVTVVYDDGTLQDAYDAKYGSGTVAVQSALQPVET